MLDLISVVKGSGGSGWFVRVDVEVQKWQWLVRLQDAASVTSRGRRRNTRKDRFHSGVLRVYCCALGKTKHLV